MAHSVDMWSIVSAKDGKPYVQFRFSVPLPDPPDKNCITQGDGSCTGPGPCLHSEPIKFQLTPDEAREHASKIMQVAFAADTDAFFVEFIQTKIGVDLAKAVRVLQDFREWREGKSSKTDKMRKKAYEDQKKEGGGDTGN